MITVRELITNALSEARLVPRTQPVPGHLFVDALRLLQARIAQYNNTNYLSFTRKEKNFTGSKDELVLGSYVLTDDWVEGTNFYFDVDALPESPEIGWKAWDKDKRTAIVTEEQGYPSWRVYTWNTRDIALTQVQDCFATIPDVEVTDIQEITRCYVQVGTDWDEVRFCSWEDSFGCRNYYTWKPEDEDHVLYKAPDFANRTVKIVYNSIFTIDADTELRLPGQYISLLTMALTYDLAIQFPRLGDSTVNMLLSRLSELEENIRRSTSTNKFIRRRDNVSWSDGYRGAFLL